MNKPIAPTPSAAAGITALLGTICIWIWPLSACAALYQKHLLGKTEGGVGVLATDPATWTPEVIRIVDTAAQMMRAGQIALCAGLFLVSVTAYGFGFRTRWLWVYAIVASLFVSVAFTHGLYLAPLPVALLIWRRADWGIAVKSQAVSPT